MTGLYACASHLLVDLPLFGGPVLFVVAAIVFVSRSERRRAAHAEEAEGARPEGPRPEGARPWSGGEDVALAQGPG